MYGIIFFERLGADEFHYFRFIDELFVMQKLYYVEIAKRYSLYVKENTVLPVRKNVSAIAVDLMGCRSDGPV